MSQFDVRIFGDPVLRQRAKPVERFDERLRRLADDLLETMRAASGVGLAANQVGVLKRVFTWELPADDDREGQHGAVVNPVVEDSSEDVQEGEEGCLSFPGLFYPLERPLRVRVRHQDLHGEEHRRDLEGFLARVWLHEIDHLNGILFIDHLAEHDRRDALRRMREFRLHGPVDGDAVPPSAIPARPHDVPGRPPDVPGRPPDVPGRPHDVPGRPPDFPGRPPGDRSDVDLDGGPGPLLRRRGG